jgi:hypothetical protein
MNISSVVNNDIELIKKAKKKLIDASDASNSKSWFPYSNINGNIKVYTEDVQKNGCCSVCGTGIIHAMPKQIVEAIRSQKNWKKMDDMLEKSEYIDLSEDQRIIHFMFDKFFTFFSKRDVVFLETVHKNKDGSYMITSTKTGMDLYPTKQEYIRSELISGGWYIQPFEKNKCIVTYYTNIDFKLEYITPQMLNFFTSKIPNVINKIGEIISKMSDDKKVEKK